MKLNEIKKSKFLTDPVKIKKWLIEMGIQNYTIRDDGTVDVEDSVYLSHKGLTKFPVKFGEVGRDFDCNENMLVSLEGAPYDIQGDFDCSNNQLESLKGGPSKVLFSYRCDNNKLKSLEGAPTFVGSSFKCSDNLLTTLEGAPSNVGGDFDCDANKLTSMQGAPSKIDGYFSCDFNTQKVSLIGISDIITKMDGSFYTNFNEIISGGLGLVLIEGCTGVAQSDGFDVNKIAKIIRKYLGKPDSLFECQEELINAGFEKYAQL